MGKFKKKRKKIAIADRGANFANQIHCFSLFYHTRAQSVQRTIKMFTSPNLSFDGNKIKLCQLLSGNDMREGEG